MSARRKMEGPARRKPAVVGDAPRVPARATAADRAARRRERDQRSREQQARAREIAERLSAALGAELARELALHDLNLSEIEARCGLDRKSTRNVLRGDQGLTFYNLARLLVALESSGLVLGADGFVFFIRAPGRAGKQG